MTYALTNTDLTGLGGPMGTERVSDRWTKYFESVASAKRYAEKDYNQTRGPIKWTRKGKSWSSQDLGYVTYDITPLKIEEVK